MRGIAQTFTAVYSKIFNVTVISKITISRRSSAAVWENNNHKYDSSFVVLIATINFYCDLLSFSFSFRDR